MLAIFECDFPVGTTGRFFKSAMHRYQLEQLASRPAPSGTASPTETLE